MINLDIFCMTIQYYSVLDKLPQNWDNFFRENVVFPSNLMSFGYKIKK